MPVLAFENDTVIDGHLEPREVAAYIDRAVDDAARTAIEAHLAGCAECRVELVEASRAVATLPSRKAARIWVPAAAAAVLIAIVLPIGLRESGTHRESPVTATVAPVASAPVGRVDSATALVWSSVPHADRYRARIFDGDGVVIWEHETTDTVVAVPASAALRPSRPYFWRVYAQIGFDRTAASELTEFSVRTTRRQ